MLQALVPLAPVLGLEPEDVVHLCAVWAHLERALEEALRGVPVGVAPVRARGVPGKGRREEDAREDLRGDALGGPAEEPEQRARDEQAEPERREEEEALADHRPHGEEQVAEGERGAHHEREEHERLGGERPHAHGREAQEGEVRRDAVEVAGGRSGTR